MLLMAKAQCHCAVCGNDFEIKVKRRNREEATSFEEWAAKNITVCRGCEQKIRKQENHKRALENSKENIGDPSEMGFWAGLFGNLTDFSDFPHKDK